MNGICFSYEAIILQILMKKWGALLIQTWRARNLILNRCDKFIFDAAMAVISFFINLWSKDLQLYFSTIFN